tara:strand:- start:2591 stop:3979 length:1389 start_codon:yes stop_codon:yes gene_type:complete
MSYIISSDSKGGQVLNVDSSEIDEFIENNTHFDYPLNDSIVCPQDSHILLSLYDAVIPHTFYRIEGGQEIQGQNNIIPFYFKATIGGITAEYNFLQFGAEQLVAGIGDFNLNVDTINSRAVGNFNIVDFVNNLQIQTNNFLGITANSFRTAWETQFGAGRFPYGDGFRIKWSYDRNSSKLIYQLTEGLVNFKTTSAYAFEMGFDSAYWGIGNNRPVPATHPYILRLGSVNTTGRQYNITCYKFLGFPRRAKITFITSVYGEELPNVFDMNGNKHTIQIYASISGTSVISGQDQSYTDMIGRLPITNAVGDVIYAEPNSNRHKIKLDGLLITSMKIMLADDLGRPLNLNGNDFTLGISLQYIPAPINQQIQSHLTAENRRQYEPVQNPTGRETIPLETYARQGNANRGLTFFTNNKAKQQQQILQAQQRQEEIEKQNAPKKERRGRPRRVGRPKKSKSKKEEE